MFRTVVICLTLTLASTMTAGGAQAANAIFSGALVQEAEAAAKAAIEACGYRM